jgi:hypothetical protein
MIVIKQRTKLHKMLDSLQSVDWVSALATSQILDAYSHIANLD